MEVCSDMMFIVSTCVFFIKVEEEQFAYDDLITVDCFVLVLVS